MPAMVDTLSLLNDILNNLDKFSGALGSFGVDGKKFNENLKKQLISLRRINKDIKTSVNEITKVEQDISRQKIDINTKSFKDIKTSLDKFNDIVVQKYMNLNKVISTVLYQLKNDKNVKVDKAVIEKLLRNTQDVFKKTYNEILDGAIDSGKELNKSFISIKNEIKKKGASSFLPKEKIQNLLQNVVKGLSDTQELGKPIINLFDDFVKSIKGISKKANEAVQNVSHSFKNFNQDIQDISTKLNVVGIAFNAKNIEQSLSESQKELSALYKTFEKRVSESGDKFYKNIKKYVTGMVPRFNVFPMGKLEIADNENELYTYMKTNIDNLKKMEQMSKMVKEKIRKGVGISKEEEKVLQSYNNIQAGMARGNINEARIYRELAAGWRPEGLEKFDIYAFEKPIKNAKKGLFGKADVVFKKGQEIIIADVKSVTERTFKRFQTLSAKLQERTGRTFEELLQEDRGKLLEYVKGIDKYLAEYLNRFYSQIDGYIGSAIETAKESGKPLKKIGGMVLLGTAGGTQTMNIPYKFDARVFNEKVQKIMQIREQLQKEYNNALSNNNVDVLKDFAKTFDIDAQYKSAEEESKAISKLLNRLQSQLNSNIKEITIDKSQNKQYLTEVNKLQKEVDNLINIKEKNIKKYKNIGKYGLNKSAENMLYSLLGMINRAKEYYNKIGDEKMYHALTTLSSPDEKITITAYSKSKMSTTEQKIIDINTDKIKDVKLKQRIVKEQEKIRKKYGEYKNTFREYLNKVINDTVDNLRLDTDTLTKDSKQFQQQIDNYIKDVQGMKTLPEQQGRIIKKIPFINLRKNLVNVNKLIDYLPRGMSAFITSYYDKKNDIVKYTLNVISQDVEKTQNQIKDLQKGYSNNLKEQLVTVYGNENIEQVDFSNVGGLTYSDELKSINKGYKPNLLKKDVLNYWKQYKMMQNFYKGKSSVSYIEKEIQTKVNELKILKKYIADLNAINDVSNVIQQDVNKGPQGVKRGEVVLQKEVIDNKNTRNLLLKELEKLPKGYSVFIETYYDTVAKMNKSFLTVIKQNIEKYIGKDTKSINKDLSLLRKIPTSVISGIGGKTDKGVVGAGDFNNVILDTRKKLVDYGKLLGQQVEGAFVKTDLGVNDVIDLVLKEKYNMTMEDIKQLQNKNYNEIVKDYLLERVKGVKHSASQNVEQQMKNELSNIGRGRVIENLFRNIFENTDIGGLIAEQSKNLFMSLGKSKQASIKAWKSFRNKIKGTKGSYGKLTSVLSKLLSEVSDKTSSYISEEINSFFMDVLGFLSGSGVESELFLSQKGVGPIVSQGKKGFYKRTVDTSNAINPAVLSKELQKVLADTNDFISSRLYKGKDVEIIAKMGMFDDFSAALKSIIGDLLIKQGKGSWDKMTNSQRKQIVEQAVRMAKEQVISSEERTSASSLSKYGVADLSTQEGELLKDAFRKVASAVTTSFLGKKRYAKVENFEKTRISGNLVGGRELETALLDMQFNEQTNAYELPEGYGTVDITDEIRKNYDTLISKISKQKGVDKQLVKMLNNLTKNLKSKIRTLFNAGTGGFGDFPELLNRERESYNKQLINTISKMSLEEFSKMINTLNEVMPNLFKATKDTGISSVVSTSYFKQAYKGNIDSALKSIKQKFTTKLLSLQKEATGYTEAYKLTPITKGKNIGSYQLKKVNLTNKIVEEDVLATITSLQKQLIVEREKVYNNYRIKNFKGLNIDDAVDIKRRIIGDIKNNVELMEESLRGLREQDKNSTFEQYVNTYEEYIKIVQRQIKEIDNPKIRNAINKRVKNVVDKIVKAKSVVSKSSLKTKQPGNLLTTDYVKTSESKVIRSLDNSFKKMKNVMDSMLKDPNMLIKQMIDPIIMSTMNNFTELSNFLQKFGNVLNQEITKKINNYVTDYTKGKETFKMYKDPSLIVKNMTGNIKGEKIPYNKNLLGTSFYNTTQQSLSMQVNEDVYRQMLSMMSGNIKTPESINTVAQKTVSTSSMANISDNFKKAQEETNKEATSVLSINNAINELINLLGNKVGLIKEEGNALENEIPITKNIGEGIFNIDKILQHTTGEGKKFDASMKDVLDSISIIGQEAQKFGKIGKISFDKKTIEGTANKIKQLMSDDNLLSGIGKEGNIVGIYQKRLNRIKEVWQSFFRNLSSEQKDAYIKTHQDILDNVDKKQRQINKIIKNVTGSSDLSAGKQSAAYLRQINEEFLKVKGMSFKQNKSAFTSTDDVLAMKEYKDHLKEIEKTFSVIRRTAKSPSVNLGERLESANKLLEYVDTYNNMINKVKELNKLRKEEKDILDANYKRMSAESKQTIKQLSELIQLYGQEAVLQRMPRSSSKKLKDLQVQLSLEEQIMNVEEEAKNVSVELMKLKKTHPQYVKSAVNYTRDLYVENKKVAKLMITIDKGGKVFVKTLQRGIYTASSMVTLLNMLKRVSLWGSGGFIYYGIMRQVREITTAIKEVEYEMGKLHQVMNKTVTSFNNILNSAFDISISYGKNIINVLHVMNQYARQGLKQAEVIELTKTAVVGANIGFKDEAQAMDILTAIVRQYNMDVMESARILDMLVNVADRNATTIADLGEAFKQAGAAAYVAGLKFSELTAIITTLEANTRLKGSMIGRAVRHMFSHIHSKDTVKQLSDLGISIYNTVGEYRNFMDILKDLSKTWVTLNGTQKEQLARSIAQRRYYNFFIVLMEKWNQVKKGVIEAENSHGVAMKKNEEIMKTYTRLLASTKEEYMKLYVSFGKSGLLNILKSGALTMKLFANILNAIPGPVKTILSYFAVLKVGIMSAAWAARFYLGKNLTDIIKNTGKQLITSKLHYKQIIENVLHRNTVEKQTIATQQMINTELNNQILKTKQLVALQQQQKITSIPVSQVSYKTPINTAPIFSKSVVTQGMDIRPVFDKSVLVSTQKYNTLLSKTGKVLKGIGKGITGILFSWQALVAGLGVYGVYKYWEKTRDTLNKIEKQSMKLVNFTNQMALNVKTMSIAYKEATKSLEKLSPKNIKKQQDAVNDLAIRFPQLVAYWDEYGNAVLKSNAQVSLLKNNITDLLKQYNDVSVNTTLSNIVRKLQLLNNPQTFLGALGLTDNSILENINKVEDKLSELQKKIENAQKVGNFKKQMSLWGDWQKTIKELTKNTEAFNKVIRSIEKSLETVGKIGVSNMMPVYTTLSKKGGQFGLLKDYYESLIPKTISNPAEKEIIVNRKILEILFKQYNKDLKNLIFETENTTKNQVQDLSKNLLDTLQKSFLSTFGENKIIPSNILQNKKQFDIRDIFKNMIDMSDEDIKRAISNLTKNNNPLFLVAQDMNTGYKTLTTVTEKNITVIKETKNGVVKQLYSLKDDYKKALDDVKKVYKDIPIAFTLNDVKMRSSKETLEGLTKDIEDVLKLLNDFVNIRQSEENMINKINQMNIGIAKRGLSTFTEQLDAYAVAYSRYTNVWNSLSGIMSQSLVNSNINKRINNLQLQLKTELMDLQNVYNAINRIQLGREKKGDREYIQGYLNTLKNNGLEKVKIEDIIISEEANKKTDVFIKNLQNKLTDIGKKYSLDKIFISKETLFNIDMKLSELGKGIKSVYNVNTSLWSTVPIENNIGSNVPGMTAQNISSVNSFYKQIEQFKNTLTKGVSEKDFVFLLNKNLNKGNKLIGFINKNLKEIQKISDDLNMPVFEKQTKVLKNMKKELIDVIDILTTLQTSYSSYNKSVTKDFVKNLPVKNIKQTTKIMTADIDDSLTAVASKMYNGIRMSFGNIVRAIKTEYKTIRSNLLGMWGLDTNTFKALFTGISKIMTTYKDIMNTLDNSIDKHLKRLSNSTNVVDRLYDSMHIVYNTAQKLYTQQETGFNVVKSIYSAYESKYKVSGYGNEESAKKARKDVADWYKKLIEGEIKYADLPQAIKKMYIGKDKSLINITESVKSALGDVDTAENAILDISQKQTKSKQDYAKVNIQIAQFDYKMREKQIQQLQELEKMLNNINSVYQNKVLKNAISFKNINKDTVKWVSTQRKFFADLVSRLSGDSELRKLAKNLQKSFENALGSMFYISDQKWAEILAPFKRGLNKQAYLLGASPWQDFGKKILDMLGNVLASSNEEISFFSNISDVIEKATGTEMANKIEKNLSKVKEMFKNVFDVQYSKIPITNADSFTKGIDTVFDKIKKYSNNADIQNYDKFITGKINKQSLMNTIKGYKTVQKEASKLMQKDKNYAKIKGDVIKSQILYNRKLEKVAKNYTSALRKRYDLLRMINKESTKDKLSKVIGDTVNKISKNPDLKFSDELIKTMNADNELRKLVKTSSLRKIFKESFGIIIETTMSSLSVVIDGVKKRIKETADLYSLYFISATHKITDDFNKSFEEYNRSYKRLWGLFKKNGISVIDDITKYQASSVSSMLQNVIKLYASYNTNMLRNIEKNKKSLKEEGQPFSNKYIKHDSITGSDYLDFTEPDLKKFEKRRLEFEKTEKAYKKQISLIEEQITEIKKLSIEYEKLDKQNKIWENLRKSINMVNAEVSVFGKEFSMLDKTLGYVRKLLDDMLSTVMEKGNKTWNTVSYSYKALIYGIKDYYGELEKLKQEYDILIDSVKSYFSTLESAAFSNKKIDFFSSLYDSMRRGKFKMYMNQIVKDLQQKLNEITPFGGLAGLSKVSESNKTQQDILYDKIKENVNNLLNTINNLLKDVNIDTATFNVGKGNLFFNSTNKTATNHSIGTYVDSQMKTRGVDYVPAYLNPGEIVLNPTQISQLNSLYPGIDKYFLNKVPKVTPTGVNKLQGGGYISDTGLGVGFGYSGLSNLTKKIIQEYFNSYDILNLNQSRRWILDSVAGKEIFYKLYKDPKALKKMNSILFLDFDKLNTYNEILGDDPVNFLLDKFFNDNSSLTKIKKSKGYRIGGEEVLLYSESSEKKLLKKANEFNDFIKESAQNRDLFKKYFNVDSIDELKKNKKNLSAILNDDFRNFLDRYGRSKKDEKQILGKLYKSFTKPSTFDELPKEMASMSFTASTKAINYKDINNIKQLKQQMIKDINSVDIAMAITKDASEYGRGSVTSVDDIIKNKKLKKIFDDNIKTAFDYYNKTGGIDAALNKKRLKQYHITLKDVEEGNVNPTSLRKHVSKIDKDALLNNPKYINFDIANFKGINDDILKAHLTADSTIHKFNDVINEVLKEHGLEKTIDTTYSASTFSTQTLLPQNISGKEMQEIHNEVQKRFLTRLQQDLSKLDNYRAELKQYKGVYGLEVFKTLEDGTEVSLTHIKDIGVKGNMGNAFNKAYNSKTFGVQQIAEKSNRIELDPSKSINELQDDYAKALKRQISDVELTKGAKIRKVINAYKDTALGKAIATAGGSIIGSGLDIFALSKEPDVQMTLGKSLGVIGTNLTADLLLGSLFSGGFIMPMLVGGAVASLLYEGFKYAYRDKDLRLHDNLEDIFKDVKKSEALEQAQDMIKNKYTGIKENPSKFLNNITVEQNKGIQTHLYDLYKKTVIPNLIEYNKIHPDYVQNRRKRLYPDIIETKEDLIKTKEKYKAFLNQKNSKETDITNITTMTNLDFSGIDTNVMQEDYYTKNIQNLKNDLKKYKKLTTLNLYDKNIVNALQEMWDSFAGFSEGGYTGDGYRKDVAGFVHKGEYVIPKYLMNKSDIKELVYKYIEPQRRNIYSRGSYESGGPVIDSVKGITGLNSADLTILTDEQKKLLKEANKLQRKYNASLFKVKSNINLFGVEAKKSINKLNFKSLSETLKNVKTPEEFNKALKKFTNEIIQNADKLKNIKNNQLKQYETNLKKENDALDKGAKNKIELQKNIEENKNKLNKFTEVFSEPSKMSKALEASLSVLKGFGLTAVNKMITQAGGVNANASSYLSNNFITAGASMLPTVQSRTKQYSAAGGLVGGTIGKAVAGPIGDYVGQFLGNLGGRILSDFMTSDDEKKFAALLDEKKNIENEINIRTKGINISLKALDDIFSIFYKKLDTKINAIKRGLSDLEKSLVDTRNGLSVVYYDMLSGFNWDKMSSYKDNMIKIFDEQIDAYKKMTTKILNTDITKSAQKTWGDKFKKAANSFATSISDSWESMKKGNIITPLPAVNLMVAQIKAVGSFLNDLLGPDIQVKDYSALIGQTSKIVNDVVDMMSNFYNAMQPQIVKDFTINVGKATDFVWAFAMQMRKSTELFTKQIETLSNGDQYSKGVGLNIQEVTKPYAQKAQLIKEEIAFNKKQSDMFKNLQNVFDTEQQNFANIDLQANRGPLSFIGDLFSDNSNEIQAQIQQQQAQLDAMKSSAEYAEKRMQVERKIYELQQKLAENSIDMINAVDGFVKNINASRERLYKERKAWNYVAGLFRDRGTMGSYLNRVLSEFGDSFKSILNEFNITANDVFGTMGNALKNFSNDMVAGLVNVEDRNKRLTEASDLRQKQSGESWGSYGNYVMNNIGQQSTVANNKLISMTGSPLGLSAQQITELTGVNKQVAEKVAAMSVEELYHAVKEYQTEEGRKMFAIKKKTDDMLLRVYITGMNTLVYTTDKYMQQMADTIDRWSKENQISSAAIEDAISKFSTNAQYVSGTDFYNAINGINDTANAFESFGNFTDSMKQSIQLYEKGAHGFLNITDEAKQYYGEQILNMRDYISALKQQQQGLSTIFQTRLLGYGIDTTGLNISQGLSQSDMSNIMQQIMSNTNIDDIERNALLSMVVDYNKQLLNINDKINDKQNDLVSFAKQQTELLDKLKEEYVKDYGKSTREKQFVEMNLQFLRNLEHAINPETGQIMLTQTGELNRISMSEWQQLKEFSNGEFNIATTLDEFDKMFGKKLAGEGPRDISTWAEVRPITNNIEIKLDADFLDPSQLDANTQRSIALMVKKALIDESDRFSR